MTARSNPRTIVGLFSERRHAEQAIRDLKSAGFEDEQIGVAMQNRDEQQSLLDDTGSQAADGAAKGAVSGGIVGGLIGLLGSLLVPGLGPIVVGGVLASTLTGAGVGAATGGLIGALMGLGLSEEDAQHFDRGLRSGGILVTVDAGARPDAAVGVLRSHGADLGPSAAVPGSLDVARSTGAGRSEAWRGADAPGIDNEEEILIPLMDEPVADPARDELRSGVGSDAAVRQAGRDGYDGLERRRKRARAYTGPERRLTV